ncbi:MAG: ribulose-bisphosphate carboxylase small chain [Solirubrobacteraceae bacterium]|jgi:ribulose-bisphosphate carboxylase small chain|nr:ribulose-bisphosphate carboxylase small chain [Solirubrobacteraceae bacterium]
MKITQGTFSFLPELTEEQLELQVRYAINNGWALMVEHTDDPHPRNSLWEMWEQPKFDVDADDAPLILDEVNAAREAYPARYIKLVAYDSSRGRQTTMLSIIVNRPEFEPGFRLERQEFADRAIKYTIHSYATEDPPGYRYGAKGAVKEERMAAKEEDGA